MDGTPMTISTRKGWQSHGSHAHVQTAMLVIAAVDPVEHNGGGAIHVWNTPPHPKRKQEGKESAGHRIASKYTAE